MKKTIKTISAVLAAMSILSCGKPTETKEMKMEKLISSSFEQLKREVDSISKSEGTTNDFTIKLIEVGKVEGVYQDTTLYYGSQVKCLVNGDIKGWKVFNNDTLIMNYITNGRIDSIIKKRVVNK